MEDKTTRIDPKFKDEIEEIKKERLNRKIDKKKVSSRAITSMIPRHKFWARIKGDIINYKCKKEINFKKEE